MSRRPWRLSIGIQIDLGPTPDDERESATDSLIERAEPMDRYPLGFQPSYVQPEDRR